MNTVTRAIRRRILDRVDPTARLVGSPASRTAGGDLMNRIAAVGILRLALRWPALSVVLIVSVLAARLMARRRNPQSLCPPPSSPAAVRVGA
jgi:hypothetical protein